jgi:hypothetical protein
MCDLPDLIGDLALFLIARLLVIVADLRVQGCFDGRLLIVHLEENACTLAPVDVTLA